MLAEPQIFAGEVSKHCRNYSRERTQQTFRLIDAFLVYTAREQGPVDIRGDAALDTMRRCSCRRIRRHNEADCPIDCQDQCSDDYPPAWLEIHIQNGSQHSGNSYSLQYTEKPVRSALEFQQSVAYHAEKYQHGCSPEHLQIDLALGLADAYLLRVGKRKRYSSYKYE